MILQESNLTDKLKTCKLEETMGEEKTYTLIVRGLGIGEAKDLIDYYGGSVTWRALKNGDSVTYPSYLPCEITTEEIKTRNSDKI